MVSPVLRATAPDPKRRDSSGSAPTHPASFTRKTLRFIGRVVLFALGILFLLMALGYWADIQTWQLSYRDPQPQSPYSVSMNVIPRVRNYPDPQNGVSWCLGLVFGMLAMITLNAAFRGKRGRGPVDWLVWPLGAGSVLSLVAALVALGMLISVIPRHRMYLFDAEKTAEVFATGIDEETLTNSGPILFARGKEDGKTHMAYLRPALIRALDRRSLEIGRVELRHRELAVPGLGPIVLLLLLALMRYLSTARSYYGTVSDRFELGIGGVVFGCTCLYLMLWLSMGQIGNAIQMAGTAPTFLGPYGWWDSVIEKSNEGSMPLPDMVQAALDGTLVKIIMSVGYMRMYELPISGGLLLIGGLVLIACVSRRIKDEKVPVFVRMGWMNLYVIVYLVTVIGISAVSYCSPGTPIRLWMAAFAVAGTAYWAFVFRTWIRASGRRWWGGYETA